jgi:asparagine synthase (glutamine-hydrolysing)
MPSVALAPRRRVENLYARLRTRLFPPAVRRAILHVERRRLTYLPYARLNRLAQLCLAHERAGIPGIIVEAGCALGGASIVMTASKARERPLQVYDVFGMIPPPSDKDGEDVQQRYAVIRSGNSEGLGGDVYYGYVDNLYERVRRNFADAGFPCEENGVRLVQGLVQETLVIDGPVSLAHIDVDWYEPVSTCLTRLEPRLAPGGSLVLDDYDAWSGCRRAVDDYFRNRDRAHYRFDDRSGPLVVTRER